MKTEIGEIPNYCERCKTKYGTKRNMFDYSICVRADARSVCDECNELEEIEQAKELKKEKEE